MKIKLRTLIDSVESLRQIQMLDLPSTTAFKLSQFLRRANECLEDAQTQINNIKVRTNHPEENKVQEIEDLLNSEIDLPDFSLSLDDFKEIKVKAKVFADLHWLFS